MSENPLKKIRHFIFKFQHPDLDQSAINLIHDQHLRTAFTRYGQRIKEQNNPDPTTSSNLSKYPIVKTESVSAQNISLSTSSNTTSSLGNSPSLVTYPDPDDPPKDPADRKTLEEVSNKWDSQGNYIPKPSDPADYDPLNEGIVKFERNRTSWRSDCSGSWPPHRQSQTATDLTVLCRDLIQQRGIFFIHFSRHPLYRSCATFRPGQLVI